MAYPRFLAVVAFLPFLPQLYAQSSMSTWFYYDSNGQKQGPISGGQLKGLAKAGMITPETVVETETEKGIKTAKAGKVKGLTFIAVPEPTQDIISPPAAENSFTAEEQAEIDKFCAEQCRKVALDGNVKKANKDGVTLLHRAAIEQNLVASRYLVSQGADVNAKNIVGETPLHHAAVHTTINTAIIEFLISNGADMSTKNNRGETPLLSAMAWNNEAPEVIKFLVLKGADVNVKDNEGKTPLHYVTGLFGNLEIVRFLISKGADVNVRDKEGDTPLGLAKLYKENTAIVAYLETLTTIPPSITLSDSERASRDCDFFSKLDSVNAFIASTKSQTNLPRQQAGTPQMNGAQKPVHKHKMPLYGLLGFGVMFVPVIFIGILIFFDLDFPFDPALYFSCTGTSIIAGLGIVFFALANETRCPSCGKSWAIKKQELQPLYQSHTSNLQHHADNPTIPVIPVQKEFKCKHCGYEWIYQYG
jgi:ankyrin repeat protein